MFPSSAHACLVHGDLDQPCTEPGFLAKLPEIFEGLEHRFLCGIFCVRLITKNRVSGRIDTPLIGLDQLVKEFTLTVPNAPDQRCLSLILHRMHR